MENARMGCQGLHGPLMPCAPPAALCCACTRGAPTRRIPGIAGGALGAGVAKVVLGALLGAFSAVQRPSERFGTFLAFTSRMKTIKLLPGYVIHVRKEVHTWVRTEPG